VCRKCIYEQFALEYVMYDHFTRFCGRTLVPEEADFFYLPIIRDLDYRIALQKGDRKPSPIDQALLHALENRDFTGWHQVFNVTSEYFRRHDGADHIIVMPAPVTNFRHQTNMRGFFHYVRGVTIVLIDLIELLYIDASTVSAAIPFGGAVALLSQRIS